MTHAIEIAGLSKRFGGTVALNGLTLSVPTATLFGFLGPNGAGKTTTIRAILGLVRPDSGSVTVLGVDPQTGGERVRRTTGALLEHDGLYDRLSALENLEYHARIHRLRAAERRERIGQLLTAFGLAGRRDDLVGRWSRGMRQKLAIARALLHRPELLLLDEPFAGLDPAAAVELREALVRIVADDGTTLFLTSHDLAHVEKICTHVAIIRAGTIIAAGAPSELRPSRDCIDVEVSGLGLTAELLASMVRDGLLLSYSLDGIRARVTCTPAARSLLGTELVCRGVAIEELCTHRSTLEEAFLALVGAPEQTP